MTRPKNSSSPCFCATECPPETRPFQKYAIRVVGETDVPGYENFKLMLLFLHTAAGALCVWHPEKPVGAPAKEDLVKTIPI